MFYDSIKSRLNRTNGLTIRYGPIRENPDRIHPWSKMVENGQNWSKMVENGQKWSKMVENGRKWSKTVKNGRN